MKKRIFFAIVLTLTVLACLVLATPAAGTVVEGGYGYGYGYCEE